MPSDALTKSSANTLLFKVIPITDAMREPHKFPKVLTGVMAGLLGMYAITCDARRFANYNSKSFLVALVCSPTLPSVQRSKLLFWSISI